MFQNKLSTNRSSSLKNCCVGVPQGTIICTRLRIPRQHKILQQKSLSIIARQCKNDDQIEEQKQAEEGSFYLPVDVLKSALQKAIDNENYDLAAQLNNQIKLREKNDPVRILQQKLDQAIQDECFTDAVILRDQLNLRLSQDQTSSILRCSSNTLTHNIRVMVDSAYSQTFSKPKQHQHVFMYRIRILNESDQTVQISKRKFIFTDDMGFMMLMEGPGIGGEQCIVHPGQEYKFSGMYPLQTCKGFMEGEFVCQQGGEEIGVKLGRLRLDSEVFHWPEDIVFIPYDN